MARQGLMVTPLPGVTDAQIEATEPEFRAMVAAADEQYEAATALAVQLAYDGPLTIPAVMDRLRFYQRRTVDDCLELGKGLLLLKEMAGHGQFVQALTDLGFAERSARRFMSAAVKTAKSANLAVLARKASSAGVMLEFLTLDDDEAADWLDGGTVAGLTFDEADHMTATALRAAFRRAKELDKAKDQVLADKSAKIDKMATEIARLKAKRDQGSLLIQVAVGSPDAQRDQLLAELTTRASSIEMRIRGDLHLAIGALNEHLASLGADRSADNHIAGALGAVAAAVDEVRAEWGVSGAPTGRYPGAQYWDAMAAEDAMTPAERAAADRAAADELVAAARKGGNSDAEIARMHPGVWAASSFAVQVVRTPDAPVPGTEYADPEDPSRVYVVGGEVAHWMRLSMASQGYDPENGGDVKAYCLAYLVRGAV